MLAFFGVGLQHRGPLSIFGSNPSLHECCDRWDLFRHLHVSILAGCHLA